MAPTKVGATIVQLGAMWPARVSPETQSQLNRSTKNWTSNPVHSPSVPTESVYDSSIPHVSSSVSELQTHNQLLVGTERDERWAPRSICFVFYKKEVFGSMYATVTVQPVSWARSGLRCGRPRACRCCFIC